MKRTFLLGFALALLSVLSAMAQVYTSDSKGNEAYQWMHQFFSDEEILRDFYYFGVRDHEDDEEEYDYTAGTTEEQLARLFAPTAPMINYVQQTCALLDHARRKDAPQGVLSVEAWNGGKMTVPYKTVGGRTVVDGICRYTCNVAQSPDATGRNYKRETYNVTLTLTVRQGKAIDLKVSGTKQYWMPNTRILKNYRTEQEQRIALSRTKPIVKKTVTVRTKDDFPFNLDACLHECRDLFGHALPADEKETIKNFIYGFANFSTFTTKFAERHAPLMLQSLDLTLIENSTSL